MVVLREYKFRKTDLKWTMITGIFLTISGCGQPLKSLESTTDSTPESEGTQAKSQTSPSPNDQANSLKPEIDQNFCKGLRPGACFSLVLRVPQPSLVRDLGLATLSLASDSRVMEKRLEESCYAAWNEYKERYRENAHFK